VARGASTVHPPARPRRLFLGTPQPPLCRIRSDPSVAGFQAHGPHLIAVDTSGSIGEKELSEFQAEVQATLDECKPDAIDVVYCDCRVNGVQEFTPGDLVKLRPMGGGGTMFEPVFDYIVSADLPESAEYSRYEHDEPECLIYLTDGYGSFPESAPNYPVLWASTQKETFPFGQVVAVK
jgi:predicted metal-dependent peptidase